MDNEQLIGRMRERVKQLRRMGNMAHDPRVQALLSGVIGEIEADIERLSKEAGAGPEAG